MVTRGSCAGADVNASSPIIGTALHVACADNIPNRLDILQQLLEAGADPNVLVESDEGPPLRPVLAEYLASNEGQPCAVVVGMLLRYGAKVGATLRDTDSAPCERHSDSKPYPRLQVVMKTQFRDPHGLLNSLQSLGQHEDVFCTLLEAAESFDTCMIRRSQFLTDEQRAVLMQLATSPLPLRQQVSRNLFSKQVSHGKWPEVTATSKEIGHSCTTA